MSDATYVDLSVLDALAGRLRQAGDSLDLAGDKVTGVPDAGDVTALIGAVVAHLAGGAGNLVVGLWEVSDRVSRSRGTFSREDTEAAENFHGLF